MPGGPTFSRIPGGAARSPCSPLPRMRHACVMPVTAPVLRVLAVPAAAHAPGFAVEASPGLDAAIGRLGGDDFDLLLLDGGAEAADVDTLRRKIAVRVRAGVRGSDVVAAIDDDAFAVMLGSILAPADADRVAEKLVAALLAPFMIVAIDRSVAVASGIAY